MIPSFEFYRPKSLGEACALLATEGGVPIAGGTDLIRMMRSKKKSPKVVIDLSGLDELRYIREEGSQIHIGALTTHAEMESSELIGAKAGLLAQAAGKVGGPQIRARGTLGGNIATASPAADTVPPLLVLEAQATLVSREGERTIPLESLLVGPGETCVRGDEIIKAVCFRAMSSEQRGIFLKLGRRRAMAISLVTVAVLVTLEGNRISDARIALGAVAPTVVRAPEAERLLLQRALDAKAIQEAGEAAALASKPISDIRASVEYRREMVRVLVAKALREVADRGAP